VAYRGVHPCNHSGSSFSRLITKSYVAWNWIRNMRIFHFSITNSPLREAAAEKHRGRCVAGVCNCNCGKVYFDTHTPTAARAYLIKTWRSSLAGTRFFSPLQNKRAMGIRPNTERERESNSRGICWANKLFSPTLCLIGIPTNPLITRATHSSKLNSLSEIRAHFSTDSIDFLRF